MSKSFQVPEAIVVRPWAAADQSVRPEIKTFLQFATYIWLDDPSAITDAQSKFSVVKQHRWSAVIGKFEATKPGNWITLEDEDYVVLRKIVEAPSRVFPGNNVMMACLPFSDVVLSAVSQIPAEPVAAANGSA